MSNLISKLLTNLKEGTISSQELFILRKEFSDIERCAGCLSYSCQCNEYPEPDNY